MKIADIEIGKIYRIKNNPNFFMPTKILKPGEEENYKTYTVVKGKWSTDIKFTFGVYKYFSPTNLIKNV